MATEKDGHDIAEKISQLKLEQETENREKDEQKNQNAESNAGYNRYKQVKFLGSDAFGYVNLVIDKQNKSENEEEAYKAMKVMKKMDSCAANEISLLSKIHHENIVRYFEHFDQVIDALDYTCIITEHCQNGDLRKMIAVAQRNSTQFNETEILDWMIQATNGLKYLHEKCQIVHRDIKPAHILLTKHNVVKLESFAIAKSLINDVGQTYSGTPIYMSPEQSKGRLFGQQPEQEYRIHSYNTDIWSLGCVLYELIHLKYAFPKGQFKDDTEIPNLGDSGRFSDILKKMLVKNPDERIDSTTLYSDLVSLNEQTPSITSIRL